VQMFLLRHVNADNPIAVNLGVPRSSPHHSGSRTFHVMLRPFVDTNLLRVHVSKRESVAGNTNALTLNCTMNERCTVGRGAGRC
jgi:hypothetical protein